MSNHKIADLEASGQIVIYSRIDGTFVSACAPITSTKDEVEAFVNANVRPGAPYGAINKVDFGKSQGINMGAETPSPCSVMPGGRLHWFLVSVRLL